ncbi:hypothetical protein V8F20_005765 [Naviculisporaceae sp. PSN 640]
MVHVLWYLFRLDRLTIFVRTVVSPVLCILLRAFGLEEMPFCFLLSPHFSLELCCVFWSLAWLFGVLLLLFLSSFRLFGRGRGGDRRARAWCLTPPLHGTLRGFPVY